VFTAAKDDYEDRTKSVAMQGVQKTSEGLMVSNLLESQSTMYIIYQPNCLPIQYMY